MKRRFQIVVILIFIVVALPLQTNLFSQKLAVKGVLDLRDVDFEANRVFYLNGEWEFFWNRHLEPEIFTDAEIPAHDLFGQVPSYWTEYSLFGKSLPAHGFCTYRLLILLPPDFKDDLLCDVPVYDSSFKLFINGEYVGGNGIVGTNPDNSEPGYEPFLVGLSPADSIEILVQVSNFQHRRGGFWKPMKIGMAHQINQQQGQYTFVSYLSLGILLAFSLFFFFFYLFYRRDKMPLLFSIFLAGFFLRLNATGIYPITLLTNISWDWMVRMEYLGMYAAGISGIWFFHLLYPIKIMKWVNVGNTVVLLIFILIILFTGADTFAYTMLYFQFLAIFYLLLYLMYSLIMVFRKGIVNLVYFSGFLILLASLLNDVVLANSRLAFTRDYTIHIAVQIFIFIHAIMLIRTWVKSFIEKERLNREIEYLNANLEKIISERTAQLQDRSIEIVNQNEKIAVQNDRLKEEIEFKNRVFSIIAHDLKSPIGSLLLFFDVINKNSDESIKTLALKSIHNLTISINDLIDNLLYWGRSQGGQIAVKNNNTELDDVLYKIIGLFKESAGQKSIRIDFTGDKGHFAFCDPELLQIVIRNLVSNAVKFTPEGGSIELKVRTRPEDSSLIEVSISDNGVGIPSDKLKVLFSGQKPESTFGTLREKGTGLGLRLCFDLVKLMGGDIEIASEPAKGTVISVLLHASPRS